MKRLIALLIIFLSLSSWVWAEETELKKKSAPASPLDVIGQWEMIWQKNGGMIKDSDPYVFSHQRFEFFSDGYYKNIASDKPLDAAALVVWKAAPKTTKYGFLSPGLLLLTGAGGDKTVIVATVVLDDFVTGLKPDAPLLKQGDLLLSYLTPDKKVYLQRYLRRVR